MTVYLVYQCGDDDSMIDGIFISLTAAQRSKSCGRKGWVRLRDNLWTNGRSGSKGAYIEAHQVQSDLDQTFGLTEGHTVV